MAEESKPITREQSTIQFPYSDLSEAVDLARKIHEAGGPVSRDQLAGMMNQKPSSGAFGVKISAARMFGLVEQTATGKFQLTQLGYAIIDPDEQRQKSARVEAFLNVPLYKRTFDEFRGKMLPPRPHGLEQAFVNMGVAQKQKTNARLAFDRSAKLAGFFSVSPDRLIEPVLGTPSRPEVAASVVEELDGNARSLSQADRHDAPDLDPLIVALLQKMPSAEKPWPLNLRARWLRTLEMNLAQIYPAESGEEATLHLAIPQAKC